MLDKRGALHLKPRPPRPLTMTTGLSVVSATTLTPSDIEIATRAADHFTRLYYTTYDSDTRVVDLPQFYRPTSTLTWNGEPVTGVDGVKNLVENMPPTKHEMHSFDCHPIPGSQPPSLLVVVSGNVTHGLGPAGNPPNTPNKTIEGHPRVFSQSFMLLPDSTAPTTKPGEVAKYYIGADTLRFVG
ncbi:hypothetical protein D9611_005575 [Ephemerocybe angulata]|uniref:NTF2 domain-containing protein n=1 Tax=Ephemerocybe angulata TaxID=980116 RepID=A0A8H5BJF2_9AGAR|nr:hypothetical protein D9611_005575 [Tulosesus angulatus]